LDLKDDIGAPEVEMTALHSGQGEPMEQSTWRGLFEAIRPPKRKKIDEAECEAQYERDLFQCKMVGLPECYAQAMERRAACPAGRPIPPFNY